MASRKIREVRQTRGFIKQFQRLPLKLQVQATDKLEQFLADPYAKTLNNHALVGKYRGFRSINITGDVRALYYEKDETIIVFAFIGTHAQLYRK